MREIRWTGKALSDLERLYTFLAPKNEQAANRVMKTLISAPSVLVTNPRIGEQLFQFAPREVRRLLISDYEMRYELRDADIFILRIWHTREQR
ncbi:type II toxin-antitoxin system RelE/ParE family toxin [Tepidiphilus sp. J10]|uniref:type II toxin-antitoxin system RelE/ParE family toxin n=1 Tax=Tepidiphilus sp. J10 TaxID=2502185 RepID=UPI00115D4137|nr:type II toxin-antitoxin system RelE/ParE family toxin [Tepidiphilus sp. J10]